MFYFLFVLFFHSSVHFLLFTLFIPGNACSEELVHLVRNPLNKSDKNAIKVMTEDMDEQVGHIRADDAKIMSEALSIFRILLDGTVLEGGDNYKDPVELDVHLTDELVQGGEVISFLRQKFGSRFNSR